MTPTRAISEKESADRKAIGDEFRRSQELQRHEEAIRHLRYSINALIQKEKWHQERIAELKLKEGAHHEDR